MKRLGYLYDKICNLNNINYTFNEICKKIKNKRKLEYLKENRLLYICKIFNILKSKNYEPGFSHVFTIYEPKKRRIVSLNLQDKIINHLVSKFIISPAVLPCLIDENVASRKGLGTRKGLELYNFFRKKCDIKYGNYFILKCDISKFFQSINHNILMEKLQKKIKDGDALNIIFKIINAEKNGLSIGAMCSQLVAIFYLNDLDHYIKETLRVKYYVRYQDDFLLFHPSKEYLKYCLEKIKLFLDKECLTLNKKTRIYSSQDKFLFLGRTLNGKYAKYRTIKRRLKKRKYLYSTKKISLGSYASSMISYNFLNKKRY